MMTVARRLKFALWFSLLVTTGCAADLPQAPTNQLIKGPFTVTADWQTITLDEPLKTLPHVQFLELLLDTKQYEPVQNVEEDEFHGIGASYRHAGKDKAIRIALLLVDKKGLEFRATVTNSGFRVTELGTYGNISLSPNGDKGKFYYSKDTEFVAIRIKANTTIKVSHLLWFAPYYYRAPDKKWNDAHPSKIVTLK